MIKGCLFLLRSAIMRHLGEFLLVKFVASIHLVARLDSSGWSKRSKNDLRSMSAAELGSNSAGNSPRGPGNTRPIHEGR